MRMMLSILVIGQILLCFKISSAVADDIAKPHITAPQFQASAEEKREESMLTACDRKADVRRLVNYDRFSFIERCLATQHFDNSRP